MGSADGGDSYHHDVFVSYSFKDKNVADAIVADFEGHGVRCWYAPRDNMAGRPYDEAIAVDGIGRARLVVLIFTAESNHSDQVLDEIRLAVSEGLTIVPFRLSDEPMNATLRFRLGTVNWLDALTGPLAKDIERLRNQVVANLGSQFPDWSPSLVSSEDAKGAVAKISPSSATVEVGQKLALTFEVEPPSKSVTWSSSDAAIAAVEDGVVTGVSCGDANILATAADGEFASCKVTVLEAPADPSDSLPAHLRRLRWPLTALVVALVIVVAALLLGHREPPLSAGPSDSPATSHATIALMPDIAEDVEKLEDLADSRSFGTRYARRQVSSITFSSSAPADAQGEGFDVSESHDGSVTAWFSENSGGYYDVLITANGAIGAPSDCRYLFAGYTNMQKIDFGDAFKVQGIENAKAMFWGCSALKFLDVSGFDTSKTTDMGWMFDGCSKLGSLDVSGFDTSKATSMRAMFYDCSSLKSLDVSGFKTAAVTNMRAMFYHCSSLKSLDVSGFKTAAVTDMSWMFDGCSKLGSLNVSGFNTAKVKQMQDMFANCSELESLDVSGFKTAAVTDMHEMFYGCSKLGSLNVSGFVTAGVTNMKSMFYGCSSLKSLDVSGFKTPRVTDVSWVFARCPSLTKLDMSGWDVSAVEEFDNAFDGDGGTLAVRYPKGDAAWERLIEKGFGKGVELVSA